jgi:PAS domain S-box-containing protein
MPNGPSGVTVADTRAVFDQLDDPGTPLDTNEVAEELDCPTEAARQNLESLAERDALKRKEFGADDTVWWRPVGAQDDDQRTAAETEQRDEFEAELRRERELTDQFRLLVEGVEEYAIFMLDRDGRVQSWNPGAERIKGYQEAEILGEHLSAFYTEEAVEEGVPQRNLEQALENGHAEDEGWRVRKDGRQFWAEVTITPIRDEDGELEGYAKVTHDMTERHDREQEIRQEKERFKRLVDEVKDYAIFMLDPEGIIQTWNKGAERLKGYSETEIVGEHLSRFYPEDAAASSEQLLAAAAAKGRVADEGWRVRKDGTRFWASIVITALYDDGELRGYVKMTRDLTERKRREDRLTALDEMGRALLQAETATAVTDVVVQAAEADLDLPISAVALYDDDSGTLRTTSQTARAEEYQESVSFLDPAKDISWDVFGDDEVLVVDDIADEAGSDHPVTCGVLAPLGRHGVFITGFTTPEEPSEEAVDFVKIVAADLEAALNHAERQELLRERETALAEQNESLKRLNRINGVIRRIDQALVDATTRSEIAQAVCNELATGGPYEFAWTGHHDTARETLTPETWAGIETGYADSLSVDTGDDRSASHPAVVATQSREPYAVQDVRSDPPFEPWRKEALKRGHRSMTSVPLLYEDSLYGVLTIQASEPDTFVGVEQRVIEELGETVAHAINALESKRALVSDDVVELELEIRDPDISILQLVAETGCTFALDSVVSQENGTLRVFFTTQGASPSAVESFAEGSFALSDLRVVAEDDEECVFEATATDESLVATLLDQGAVPQTITAADGEGRVVVTLSASADVREFVEMLQAKYPTSELTARRTRNRVARSPHEFKAAFEERLTDRQREVLQTAYFGGFFDSPRKSTGQEIGDALGVSQPTVNHHLRTCQRELLGMLYEEEPTTSLDR